MNVYGRIYQARNIETNQVYIGKTIKTLDVYKKEHIWSALRNSDYNRRYFYNAIRKYGIEKFIWVELGVCSSKEELNEAEKLCIEFFESTNPIYGYNLAKGGDGGDVSNRVGKTFIEVFGEYRAKEIGARISTSKRGKPGWNLGVKHSEEWKQKISKTLMNHIVTEETRKKLSLRNRGKTWSEEQKVKLKDKVPWNKGKSNHLSTETLEKMRQAGLKRFHKSHKLTKAHVITIKKMLLEGQSQSSIARMFQVSTTLINSIANGKLWRHVVVIKGDY